MPLLRKSIRHRIDGYTLPIVSRSVVYGGELEGMESGGLSPLRLASHTLITKACITSP